MSMNFGREQALLRQRLTEKGTPERGADQQARYGDQIKCLGASDDEVRAAAQDLLDQFPSMGRAQTTAFVRTLWGSKTHELRGVGAQILSRRADILEPPDLGFVEGLLKDVHDEALRTSLAAEVLGVLVQKNKKLWKELQRLAQEDDAQLQLAAVLAAKGPCSVDGGVFDRFAKLASPLLKSGDAAVLAAIDDVLAAAADQATDAVREFAAMHGRELG